MRTSEWDSEICAICLEVVRQDQPVYTMSCAHLFHYGCAERWYRRDETRTCPVCRSGLDRDV
ncbi:RING/U-box domain-containing protein [Rhexocercosporidium sp. MPI-PUGE-AT-0058]|nr:RING/U-box domain-containing protein [Rhexocercosporidium sp. MPI-PUGE-AT-0058]